MKGSAANIGHSKRSRATDNVVLALLLLLTFASFSIAMPVELEVRAQNQIFASSWANSDNVNDGIGRGQDQYRLYQGNGSDWPKMSEWVSFQQM